MNAMKYKASHNIQIEIHLKYVLLQTLIKFILK